MNNKITANLIQKELMNFARGQYDVILPNFHFGGNECDLFRITHSDLVVEYEIKISRADFFADFNKTCSDGLKHDKLSKGEGWNCPNRFFFVVPENMVSIDEVPKYAGLIYFKNGWFDMKRSAKMLHKVRFNDFRRICHILASRDEEHRKIIKKIRNKGFDKEIYQLKKENEQLKKQRTESNNEYFLLKSEMRQLNKPTP